MNSILLCEGVTDFTLLQIYMCESNGWSDDKALQTSALLIPDQRSRVLKKNDDLLTVMSTGGCSRIPEALELVLKRTKSAAPPFIEAYKKIAIVTDNDDPGCKIRSGGVKVSFEPVHAIRRTGTGIHTTVCFKSGYMNILMT